MKIIYLTAMHERRRTVDFCLNQSPQLNRLFVFSNDLDGKFLIDKNILCFKYENYPLSFKWNYGIKLLRYIDFDAVCILGSDDYVSEGFDSFISNKIKDGYDFIGFTDMYFTENGVNYYWGGYNCNRKGEPIGAGRVITKELLIKIDFDLYRYAKNSGLDKMAWDILKHEFNNPYITTMKENNIKIVDVKDGEGITKLSSISNLIQL